MIDEGKKLSAFDVMEAVCNASKVYAEKGIKDRQMECRLVVDEIAILYFYIGFFGKDREFHVVKSYRVPLDKDARGDKFEDVMKAIEEEMEKYE